MIAYRAVRAQRTYGMHRINLFLVPLDGPAGEEIAPVTWLDEHLAQQLIDDLWTAGIRPSEGAGSAGALAATQAHLKHITDILGAVLPRAIR